MACPFAQLPEELFLIIIDTAVSVFLTTDRAVVVRLCQTSTVIYNRIAPTLYHTIVASKTNRLAIEEFTNGDDTAPLAARVFSHTRWLVIVHHPAAKIPAKLLQNVEILHAPFKSIQAVAEEADRLDANAGIPASAPSSCSIRRMHMWYARYQRISELSERARQNITHICGYASCGADELHAAFLRDPATYMRFILDALPSLTHLGFDLIYLKISPSESGIVDGWEAQPFGQALYVALSYPRLNIVAIRVSARFIARWNDIILMLRQVAGQDRRLQAYKDDGGATNWEEQEASSARDAAAGRSIWTQVRPVQDIE